MNSNSSMSSKRTILTGFHTDQRGEPTPTVSPFPSLLNDSTPRRRTTLSEFYGDPISASPLRSNDAGETTDITRTNVSEAFSRITLSDSSDNQTSTLPLRPNTFNDSTPSRRRTYSEAFSTTSSLGDFSDDFTSTIIAPRNLPEPDENIELPESTQRFPIIQIPSFSDMFRFLADGFTENDRNQTCPNCRNKCC